MKRYYDRFDWEWVEDKLPLILLNVFFFFVVLTVVRYPSMFLKKHGRRHALTGLAYLLWIILGIVDLGFPHISKVPYWLFDVVLGVLGTVLTLFAAIEFKHKNVKNVASGTLDEHATVTYNEMIEHSFYQALNLVQIVYIHSFYVFSSSSIVTRMILLFFVTLPWYWRNRFPVNRFSDNYTKIDEKSTNLIRFLYRVKKYQYVFYKHFLLHGINITLCLTGKSIGNERYFRIYWVLLNVSYVMEFFLQTLVKKNYLKQQHMLHLQKVLITASSIAAIVILRGVNVPVCIASLILNFIYRKHDLFNTLLIAISYTTLTTIMSWHSS